MTVPAAKNGNCQRQRRLLHVVRKVERKKTKRLEMKASAYKLNFLYPIPTFLCIP